MDQTKVLEVGAKFTFCVWVT